MQVVSGPIGRERVHYQAPTADRLQREMRTFLTCFEGKSPMDPVLKAGLAHLWFVTIHPFDDGNGRIARAIADMMQARSEQSPQRFYSMSAQIRRERNTYYIIESWRRPRKPTSTSRAGWAGSLTALSGRSMRPRMNSPRCSKRHGSGRRILLSRSMTGSARSLIACLTASRASSPRPNGRRSRNAPRIRRCGTSMIW